MNGFDDDDELWDMDDLVSDSITGPLRAKQMVFVDQASHSLLNLLARVSPSDAAIQITGETGTGKELIARYIHRKSGRSGSFCAVNCGAISEHLAESEFFGHEAGSFTGAQGRREGWFEAAHGGTLFLDEIGDLPLPLQSKLLRALQEGEVTRIGSRKSTTVDVRVVSATNVDLNAAVSAGNFRRDLLYRLNTVSVRLPPLRERRGDIAPLVEHFIQTHSARLKRRPPTIRHDALTLLQRHSWPGNIRELENVIHFALLVAPEHEILVEHLRLQGGPELIATPRPAATSVDQRALENLGEVLRQCFRTPGRSLFNDIERRVVQDAYTHCDSNQMRTAELLGVTRNVIRTLLRRHVGAADNQGDAQCAGEDDLNDDAADPSASQVQRYDA